LKDIKLPFGLRNNELIHISKAQSGLSCECYCPKCTSPLVARKGNITAHHFAHYNSEQCEGAVETALHIATKQILSRVKKIVLPEVYVPFTSYRKACLLSPERMFCLDEVKEEYKTKDIIPDILAYSKNVPILIEVFVTHAISKQKKEKIRKIGISAIEIDLSNLQREFEYDELVEIIVNRTSNKHWIFNAKAEKIRNQFLAIGEKKITKYRYIYGCPIASAFKRGQLHAHIINDCLYCDFAYHISSNMSYVVCGGKHKIETLENLRRFYAQSKNNPT
jgi:hypothetical protein